VMAAEKCNKCGRTAYPLESVSIGPPNAKQVFHKSCFKCQNAGCTWQLTLTNYKFFDGRAYCKNHCPMTGYSNVTSEGNNWKAHGTTDTGAIAINKAMTAPKTSTVNEQLRGARETCGQCGHVSAGGNFCSSCGESIRG